jgi:MFS family permease
VTTPDVAAHTLYRPGQRWAYLAVLFLVATSNYLDRNIISVLLEPIKREFGVSDTMLGLLTGAAFTVTYSVLGVPVARWADRGNRRTIVTLALTVWSAMTALCGLAQTFWQLALARVGVGVGEAGALPPSQSLLVDYFPPSQRARALGIFMSAASAGYILGFVLGAHIAATQGWRAAFLIVGLPGLGLALLTAFVLPEPRQRLGLPAAGGGAEPMVATFKALWRKPTYRCTVIGVTAYAFFAYGAAIFAPSFMVRVLQVPMAQVGTLYGGLSALTAVIGTLLGGWLADRLATRDPRWLLRLPALGLLLAFPFYFATYMLRDFTWMLIVTAPAGVLLSAAIPAVFAGSHAVCGSKRRATSVAILLFMMSMLGTTLGPLATGVLSDALKPHYGVESLAYALVAMTSMMLVCSHFFWRASRTLVQDTEP